MNTIVFLCEDIGRKNCRQIAKSSKNVENRWVMGPQILRGGDTPNFLRQLVNAIYHLPA